MPANKEFIGIMGNIMPINEIVFFTYLIQNKKHE